MGNVWSAGFANDIIVVEQRNGTLCCSAVNVRFPGQDYVTTTFGNEQNVTVSINNTVQNFSLNELNPRNESNEGGFRFTSESLKRMRLRDDLNDITFKLCGQDVEVKARMFFWHWDSRIVITDVDGTISKSDLLGLLSCIFRFDWTRDGVCRLFSAIEKNGYKVMYLSGRPRYLAKATRDSLDGIVQHGESLPRGPVFVSDGGWRDAGFREAADTQDEEFKVPTLEQVKELFSDSHSRRDKGGPLYAGFGNRPSDAKAYLSVGIPCTSIFRLNHSEKGIEMMCGETSVAFFPNSYESLSILVDKLFPKLQPSAGPSSWTVAPRIKGYLKSLLKP